MKKIIINILKQIKSIERCIYTKIQRRKLNLVGEHFNVRKRFSVKNGCYISVGNDFLAMDGCRIEAWDKYEGDIFKPKILIGNNVSMNVDCHIGAINKVVIGNNVLLGSRVLIIDHSHGNGSLEENDIPPNKRKLYSKGPIIVGDNVWIGEGAVVLPNVTIGNGCIIGANAVVTKSFPDNCVVGGNPARLLRNKA